MSKTLYDKNGKTTILSEQGDVENYEFYIYDVYTEFNITDPIEGFKKIYDRIPRNNSKPKFVRLGCGAQYLCIVQATNDVYGSTIIFGYGRVGILHMRLSSGVWYIS